MDSQPPNAKPNAGPARSTPGGGSAASAGAAVKPQYPKPPAFLPRLLLLCLKPESWAEAARYKSRFTLLPLLIVVLLSAAAAGIYETSRIIASLETFARTYESSNPPLVLDSTGKLSVKGKLSDPIRIPIGTGGQILIDPTGATSPQSFVGTNTVVVTENEFILFGSDALRFSLPQGLESLRIKLPPEGETSVMTSASIEAWMKSFTPQFIAGGTVTVFAMSLGEAVWCAFMIFLLGPLIMLVAAGPRLNPDGADRRLILPKRAAYRMAAALLIPLVVLGGVLRASGNPIQNLLPAEGAAIFWFFAAAAMGVWTGFLARKMYGVKEPARRGG